MRLILTLTILLFILWSCGKKSEPKYQGSINNLIITS